MAQAMALVAPQIIKYAAEHPRITLEAISEAKKKMKFIPIGGGGGLFMNGSKKRKMKSRSKKRKSRSRKRKSKRNTRKSRKLLRHS
jgi:hypothetical protein